MSATPRILALPGSTRQDSYNKRLARIAAEGARQAGAEVTVIDLRDFGLPLAASRPGVPARHRPVAMGPGRA